MLGVNLITFHMSGGETYNIKTREDTEEYLDDIFSNEFVEITDDIWINTKQISSIEIEYKLIDW